MLRITAGCGGGVMGRLQSWCGVALLAAVVMAATARAGLAQAALSGEAAGDEKHRAVTYVATALLDVFYVPAKVLVGTAGVLTSSLAYLVTVGDSDAFSAVWDSAVRGDYVVTPRMVEGKDPVHFAGGGSE